MRGGDHHTITTRYNAPVPMEFRYFYPWWRVCIWVYYAAGFFRRFGRFSNVPLYTVTGEFRSYRRGRGGRFVGDRAGTAVMIYASLGDFQTAARLCVCRTKTNNTNIRIQKFLKKRELLVARYTFERCTYIV